MEPVSIAVDRSDLEKVRDVLKDAARFHEFRDRMNAAVHLATEVRWAPLTSQLMAERDRAERMLEEGSDTDLPATDETGPVEGGR